MGRHGRNIYNNDRGNVNNTLGKRGMKYGAMSVNKGKVRLGMISVVDIGKVNLLLLVKC